MKKFLAILVSLSLLLTGLSGIVFTSYAAEEGTEENPYIVTTEAELAGISQKNDCAGVWYELQADIVLSESFEPKIFYGNLRGAEKADGSKYKITLNMTRDADYAGIFKQVFGEISNIEVGGTVSGLRYVGAIAGRAYETAVISDCISSASVTGSSGMGGCVGTAQGATIENCVNKGSVNVTESTIRYAGGIVGTITAGAKIIGCSNRGNVKSDRAGGVVGYIGDNTACVVTLCHNTGTVESYTGGGAGGIVGYMTGGEITKSYNGGEVIGPSNIAGICYYAVAGKIENCFNAGKIHTASYNSGGAVGGILATGKIAVENCYNIGELASSHYATRAAPIGDYQNTNASLRSNCYYVTPGKAYAANLVTADTEITIEQWEEMAASKTLPAGFSSDVWEYVEVGASNTYPLPQIKGNGYPTGTFNDIEDGTPEHPYKVDSAADFAAIANNPSAYYIQTADINGLSSGLKTAFSGNYNGGGFKINANITDTADYVSLFYMLNGATLENIILEGSVTGVRRVGGITGYVKGATIKGCVNKAAVTGTGDGAGGIAAYIDNLVGKTEITNCKNYGAVKGSRYVGGMVGLSYDKFGGKIELCANYGKIEGITSGAAGIVGYNGMSTISACLNEGNIVAPTYAAGIIYQDAGGTAIENCLNTGALQTTSGLVSGIVNAAHAAGTITACYNTGLLTGKGIYTYPIGGYGSKGTFTNCYFATPTVTYTSYTGVTEIDDSKWLELIAENKLPDGFSSDVWEYVEDSEYPLPQLKGNNVTASSYKLPEVNTSDFGGGLGTAESPFIIANETHLANISKFPGGSFKQTADIENVTAPVSGVFTGSYNGNGFKVTLAIDKSDVSKVGLFGEANGATIENVTVNGFVNGNTYVGGIVGLGNATVIKNCVNNAEINSKGGRVGGIAGDLQTRGSEISNSVNNGSIYSSNSFCGGIIGVNGNHSIMDKLSNYGLVHGRDAVGGITGIAYSDLSNCLNAGEIIGNKYVGGIIGQIRASYGEDGTKYCLNLGTVYAYGNIASAFGVSGHTDYVIEFTNCINAGDILSASDPGEALAWGGTTCTLNNCYYLTADETAEAVGTVVPVKSLEDLKALTLEGFTDDANGYPALTANPTRKAVEFAVLDITLEGENGTFSPVGKRFALVGNKYTFRASADESYKLDILVNGSPVKENIRDAEEYSIVISGDTTVKAVVSVYVASVPEIRSFKTAFSAKENFYDPIRRKTFDKYAAVAAILYEADGFEISEFGFALSKDAAEPTTADIKCKAEKREENGRFGVVIAGEGLVSGDKYYARPYVTYTDGTESVTVYGNALSFTVAE